MATQDDVRRIAMSLPQTVEEDGRFAFAVLHREKAKAFAWVWMERIEPKKPRVPRPGVLAVRVENLAEKDIVLSLDQEKFFTEPHYNNYPAVLVRLDAVDTIELEELLLSAWKCAAPRALAKSFTPQQA